MKTAIIILIIALAGCGANMSNEDIVKQTKYCEANGLKASALLSGFGLSVKYIVCMPREQK